MEPTHTLLEPTWFWDGQSDKPLRGVAVYLVGSQYAGWVGRDHQGRAESPDRLPLEGKLITPGWVNFHCHLELSHVPRPTYTGSFVDWLGTVMRSGPQTGSQATAAAEAGMRQLIRSGTTEVIDITRWPADVRAVQSRHRLRIASCAEITGLAHREHLGQAMLHAARESQALCNDLLSPGLSPHAPYSTSASWYRESANLARQSPLTLTTHLCETPAEREFLSRQTGPFRDLWNRLGGLPPDAFAPSDSPVLWTARTGLFDHTHLVAAHVNDVTDDELRVLAANRVTVAHCPRTHAYFQREPFDLARFQRAGVTVKLGTDSVASAGGLDMLEEARLFASLHPRLTWPEALGMILRHPLTPGRPADLAVWDVHSDDPLTELRTHPQLTATQIWVNGQPSSPT